MAIKRNLLQVSDVNYQTYDFVGSDFNVSVSLGLDFS